MLNGLWIMSESEVMHYYITCNLIFKLAIALSPQLMDRHLITLALNTMMASPGHRYKLNVCHNQDVF